MEIQNHIARKVGDMVQRRIDALGVGQKMQDLPEELWHESFKYYVKEDKTRRGGPNLRLIRLDPKQPSLTVTGFIFNKFVHPYENRYITVREAARLQGFPDEVEFKGSLTSTQQQVGNAVPVQLATAIFSHICKFAGSLGLTALNGLSLFCGAGGLDIGANVAYSNNCHIDTKVAIDCCKDACDTLRGYLGKTINVVQQDITQIKNPKNCWEENALCHKLPDIIFGGPPCQAFSQAGKQKALEDPRGTLIFDFLRFIESLHPKFFVMENVSNIKSINNGILYKEIINKMVDLGYFVTDGVLCSADYGAPQKRRRALFLGTDKSLGKISLPPPTHGDCGGLFKLLPYSTVEDAFKGLPYIGTGKQ
ncbi:MAG: DNA cytosine methyltransferase [Proteobacteria bacterium]|nr:DNA cytosine methyltransferase [Pseudomonadota bacterium]